MFSSPNIVIYGIGVSQRCNGIVIMGISSLSQVLNTSDVTQCLHRQTKQRIEVES